MFGALAAPNIATSVRGRLPFHRPYGAYAEERELQFPPGDYLDTTEPEPDTLYVTVPGHLIEPLCAAMTTRRRPSTSTRA